MKQAYLLTGGNLGEREIALETASDLIAKRCGSLIRQSLLYETQPWGISGQPAFLNQALIIETSLEPRGLLREILSIEQDMGRKRIVKFGPRLIDIDILFYAEEIIHEEGLDIPHPRLTERRFALAPLSEIAAGFVHPELGKTVANLLAETGDPLEVHLYPSTSE